MTKVVNILIIALFALTALKAQPRNGEIFNPDGIELVFVEGRGDIKGFYIGKYVITQAQWRAVMGSNARTAFSGDDLPVEMISWNDAQRFLTRLNRNSGRNYRLPSEAEWEFAARGGTAGSSCSGGCNFSGSNDINSVAWHSGNSESTQPVGLKAPNELGIYDMTGNVWEFCEDWSIVNQSRVIRGGSWQQNSNGSRISSRSNAGPNSRGPGIGLRVVLPL